MNCERWPVDRLRGWNAGLTDPGTMCGGGGEVQVTSVESCSQPDAGWLAATIWHYVYCICTKIGGLLLS